MGWVSFLNEVPCDLQGTNHDDSKPVMLYNVILT